MDDSRLSHLEDNHDWQGLADELEKAIAGAQDPTQKAALHLRLGGVLLDKFLHAVKALKHFQDAFKLNPQLFEALRRARSVYWDLGKTNMVQRLLELELKSAQDSPAIVADLIELGDVQF
jgi:tetratricopeptide (TPR) repeat protein